MLKQPKGSMQTSVTFHFELDTNELYSAGTNKL